MKLMEKDAVDKDTSDQCTRIRCDHQKGVPAGYLYATIVGHLSSKQPEREYEKEQTKRGGLEVMFSTNKDKDVGKDACYCGKTQLWYKQHDPIR